MIFAKILRVALGARAAAELVKQLGTSDAEARCQMRAGGRVRSSRQKPRLELDEMS
jgi:hypothetical protein